MHDLNTPSKMKIVRHNAETLIEGPAYIAQSVSVHYGTAEMSVQCKHGKDAMIAVHLHLSGSSREAIRGILSLVVNSEFVDRKLMHETQLRRTFAIFERIMCIVVPLCDLHEA